VYFQEQLLMQGDLTGPFAANVILSHPKVEVAVLETARGGILRSGLGFGECDVGVVLNVTSDHLGLRGIDTVEQLAEVKGVIASAVKPGGHTVLNADDPLVLAMRERTPGQVVLFTMTPAGESPPVEEQLRRGGIVVRVEPGERGGGGGETIVIRDGARRIAVAPVRDVPLTFGGQARFQVQNVLAAVAAAYAQGLSAEQIRSGLMSFVPSAAMTPGRLNVVETTHGRIILDYAHNIAAIRSVLEFVAAIPAGQHLALISAPGDRRDEDLRAIGRLAGGMDVAIFKEHDHYRRGREPGAIARLMTDALLETGFPADRTATFVEEPDAIAYALGLMHPGDVALIVTDDLPAATEQLRPYLVDAPEGRISTS
jgi:cyanophycin synthetase